MAFFDSYKNIDRGGITKDSKTATKDAVLTAYSNPQSRPHAIQIVKALLDFKAHQSDDASAERLLGNLANHIAVCNKERGAGVPELTDRSLQELVRNRSAIFKKDLPDTFKDLLTRMLFNNDARQVLIDTNTAQILSRNKLISEAEARAAPPAKRVAEQILPGELAAFFNRSEQMWGIDQRKSASWTLSNFLQICCVDLSRHSSDMEKRALAHLVVQASKGLLGTQKFHEVQRQAKEVNLARERFANKLRGPLDPKRENEVSPYIAAPLQSGGQGVNYTGFLTAAKTHRNKYGQYPGFNEAMESLETRERSLSRAPRISQHLTADSARKSPTYQIRPQIMNPGASPLSTPQHQQWLDLQEDIVAGKKQMKLVDAEAVKTTRALMVCGAQVQTVTSMLDSMRRTQNGVYELNDDEERLRERVAACLAPTLQGAATSDQVAIATLCRGGDHAIQATTTQVETAAKIVHQEMVRKIHIPGCQPFETFYLFQKRRIQFWWDEQVNFIKADIIDHSPWMCSTKEPTPTEVTW